jgi:hypothetical protein
MSAPQLDYSEEEEEVDLAAFDPTVLMRALTEGLTDTLAEIGEDEEDEITPQTLLDILNEQENTDYNSDDDRDYREEVHSLVLFKCVF